MLRNSLIKTVSSTRCVNDRIIYVVMSNVALVSVYALTIDAPAPEKDIFYNQLYDVLHNFQNDTFAVLLGDFNARIGSESGPLKMTMGLTVLTE